MTRRYDPDKHHRRSIRIPGYDYAQPGAFFVTVCTQERECLFGDVIDGRTQLSDAGHMIQSVWDALPQRYPGVDIDAFVVMPNHVHGLIVLTGPIPAAPVAAGPRACPDPTQPHDFDGQPRSTDRQPPGVAPTKRMSLPDVVHRFKSLTTARYRHAVYERGWQPFPRRLWQRNYYEHVVRDDRSLQRIREYILNNPARWDMDVENPGNWPHGKTHDAARHYASIWGELP